MPADVLYRLGGLFCHQIPERSLVSGGRILPVCARCTGLYLGVFVGALAFYILRRLRGNTRTEHRQKISIPAVVCCVLGIPLLALDVFLGMTGLFESGALVRMITGLSVGFALPLFTALASGHGFPEKKELAVIICALVTAAVMMYNGFLLFYPASVIILAGFFILWIGIIRAVIKIIRS